jgi:hypothetical protein
MVKSRAGVTTPRCIRARLSRPHFGRSSLDFSTQPGLD